mgnify:CR=1 FL=1
MPSTPSRAVRRCARELRRSIGRWLAPLCATPKPRQCAHGRCAPHCESQSLCARGSHPRPRASPRARAAAGRSAPSVCSSSCAKRSSASGTRSRRRTSTSLPASRRCAPVRRQWRSRRPRLRRRARARRPPHRPRRRRQRRSQHALTAARPKSQTPSLRRWSTAAMLRRLVPTPPKASQFRRRRQSRRRLSRQTLRRLRTCRRALLRLPSVMCRPRCQWRARPSYRLSLGQPLRCSSSSTSVLGGDQVFVTDL